MKRKRNAEPVGNKKRASTNNSNGYSGNEKTLLDFWKPKQEKKENKNKNHSKSRSVSQEKENLEYKTSKNQVLVKNPSKQILMGNNLSSNLFEYKKKILFNEDFVKHFKFFLEPFTESIKDSLFSLNYESKSKLESESFDNFTNENLESIVTKFILQISDDFIFLPQSFMTKNDECLEKSKLKLIEGFNDLRHLSLQYHPLNSKEILNEDLCFALTSYLKHFNKKKKRRGNNNSHNTHNNHNGHNKDTATINQPNRRAFVIMDKDPIDKIKALEAICNDLDYKIIRLDELENGKINKLNKISEATQSQRLSCLPDTLSDKLKILERIINNDPVKFNSLLNNNSVCYNSPYSFPTNASTTNGEQTITNYFSEDTKERSVYYIIQNNIYQICAKKKTLILIVDSFANSEDDKTYLNGIISKISSTKCPIAILTNNLNFAKNDNLFNNSIKTITNNFIFYQTENNSKSIQDKTIFLTSLILFLHVVVKDQIEDILIKNENNRNEITFLIIQSLTEIFNNDYKESLTSFSAFNKISELAIKLSLIFEYNLDRIFLFISDCIRLNKDYNYKEKLNYMSEFINKYNISNEDENGAFDIQKLVLQTERNSFEDFKEGKIKKIANKQYDQFYYNINRLNKKIMKDGTITKKEPPIHKNNEQLMNLENVQCETFLEYDRNRNRNISHSHLFMKNFDEVSKEFLNEIIKEDINFYRNVLLHKISDVNSDNLYEYNYLFKKLNEIDYETFLNLFGVRKPRSTRKIVKEKDAVAMADDLKFHAFQKIFNKSINSRLLDRFYEIREANSLICRLDDNLYLNNLENKYYTGFRIYEEMKNNESYCHSRTHSEGEWSSNSEYEFSD